MCICKEFIRYHLVIPRFTIIYILQFVRITLHEIDRFTAAGELEATAGDASGATAQGGALGGGRARRRDGGNPRQRRQETQE